MFLSWSGVRGTGGSGVAAGLAGRNEEVSKKKRLAKGGVIIRKHGKSFDLGMVREATWRFRRKKDNTKKTVTSGKIERNSSGRNVGRRKGSDHRDCCWGTKKLFVRPQGKGF